MLGGKTHVLLVDDDYNNRAACSLCLHSLGFVVETASEGAEALEILDCSSPDVIILDLHMPGMDGWAFLGRYNGPIPIVVVSAWTDHQPLPREPFAVVSKPVEMREVAVLLRQAARSWGRL